LKTKSPYQDFWERNCWHQIRT